MVGIIGEPGVGKSRLLYEFRKSLEGERVTWLEGHCVAYGQATPYLPVLQVLRNPLQIDEKLRRSLRLLDPNLGRILPFLRELFGLPGEDDALKHLERKDKRRKTFEAIRALTFAGAQRRPLIIIHEDLHWIDKTSEEYLFFIIESLGGVPRSSSPPTAQGMLCDGRTRLITPRSPSTSSPRGRWRRWWRSSSRPPTSRRISSNMERARALAEDLHDEPRVARALYWLGRLHYLLADLQTAIAYAKQSLEIAERLGDDAIAAPPVNLMGRIYWLHQTSDRAARCWRGAPNRCTDSGT